MRWSDQYLLREAVNEKIAPDGPGVYEIGFARGEYFNAKYLGRALGEMGTSNSILGRPKSHFNLNGNKYIKEYLINTYDNGELIEGRRDDLYCCWCRASSPKEVEAMLLGHYGVHGKYEDSYEWNMREER